MQRAQLEDMLQKKTPRRSKPTRPSSLVETANQFIANNDIMYAVHAEPATNDYHLTSSALFIITNDHYIVDEEQRSLHCCYY